MAKVLMRGNEAMGEAAIKAGCCYFFGYPITPQSELPHYLAWRLPEEEGVFLQAESEVSAINMVYGAASAGARVMTGSSSPGISLKQEGISYICAAELPCVIANVVRGGPGLGSIQPAQSDYFQATKGGGHGDYHMIVLAPASIQEIATLTMKGFDLADKWRCPVMILGDGVLGQMMEPVDFDISTSVQKYDKSWAATGTGGVRKRNIINTLFLNTEDLEKHNEILQQKYKRIKETESYCDTYMTEDAEIVLVAYGITARLCKAVVNRARENGIKAGLIRPISLWPFPKEVFRKQAEICKTFLTVEVSAGQMVEDVRLAVNGMAPVHFYGKTAVIPTPEEIYEELEKVSKGVSL